MYTLTLLTFLVSENFVLIAFLFYTRQVNFADVTILILLLLRPDHSQQVG